MGGILVKLDLLSSFRCILWVPHRQAPEHFMVELWKPCLVPPGLAEQEQASPECFLEWNHVALLGIFGWCVLFLEWCALFWRKTALTECSPRASCYLKQKVGGSWIWVVQRTKNLFWGYVGSCQVRQAVVGELLIWWRGPENGSLQSNHTKVCNNWYTRYQVGSMSQYYKMLLNFFASCSY